MMMMMIFFRVFIEKRERNWLTASVTPGIFKASTKIAKSSGIPQAMKCIMIWMRPSCLVFLDRTRCWKIEKHINIVQMQELNVFIYFFFVGD